MMKHDLAKQKGASAARCIEVKASSHSKTKQLSLLFSLILIACVLITAPVRFAHADDNTATIDGVSYNYAIFSGDLVILEITSNNISNVVIPAQIDGMPVAYIGKTFACKMGDNIVSVDAKKCHALKGVNCSLNKYYNIGLRTLDLSNCKKLTEVRCSDNSNLTSLKVSGCTALESIDCNWTNLSSLSVSGLPALKSITCANNNNLSSINASNCTALKSLNCVSSNVSALKLSGCTALKTLTCRNNELTSLDISGLSSLKELHCGDNHIKDVSKLEAWEKESGHTGFLSPQNLISTSSIASTGKWEKGPKGWKYSYSNGAYAKGLKTISGKKYYFDSNGWMKTGWVKINGARYYFNSSGAMSTNWVKVKGSWYYMGSNGKTRTGWQTISGQKYYMSSDGKMKTGWLKSGSSWYYLNSSGAMAKGWTKVSGKWYYMTANGKMQTGWIAKGKYYCSTSGAMLTGWQKISGSWYYFNGSGVKQTNKWIGNYWVGSDGKMAINTWVDGGKYKVNAKGLWVPNAKR